MPEEAKPSLIREPRALSSEYHKARKQLMLWAGVLFIWELVGIDLNQAAESGGNVGAVLKSIRSRQAIPWALLILVGYFLFRFTVEWYQCNSSRRNMRVAKVDFYSSWFVTLVACALYLGQAVWRVQLANLSWGSLLQSALAIVSVVLTLIATGSRVGPILARWLERIRNRTRSVPKK